MDYFSILNLKKEPFSNSPDPEYFFQSRQHLGCLQKIELSIRLKRGLNVVIGDVGTGKTTLCRQLIRRFGKDSDCETHLILDPYFSTPLEFLTTVANMFEQDRSFADANEWQTKEAIKQYIFQKGVDENKTVVLIIDEGQKIPEFCLEILREFLNFETNEYKLLQIVIFAQKEFENVLDTHDNVADRINLHHLLEPLNFKDTRLMIQFRINQSSTVSENSSFFSFPALWAIYRITGGYPRKIVNLCHRIILTMIIQNRTEAGWFLVRSCARRGSLKPVSKWRWGFTMAIIVLAAVSLAVGLAPNRLKPLWDRNTDPIETKRTSTVPPNDPEVETGTGSSHVEESNLSSVRSESGENILKEKPELPAETVQIAAVKETPPVLPETAPEEKKHPPMLGQVALESNETLWRLIEKVYGIYDTKYLEQLKKANPHIKNPKQVNIGSLISIPAISLTVNPSSSGIWWVKVGEKIRLDEAIQTLRTHSEDAPPIRLVPYWNKNELKFAILLRDHFSNEMVAGNHLQALPADMASRATLLSSWDKRTVFFADPYRRPRR